MRTDELGLELDCSWTVNDIIRRHPSTIVVFNRFGLDTHGGASRTVEEATREDGVDGIAFCAQLHDVVRPRWQARRLVQRRRRLRGGSQPHPDGPTRSVPDEPREGDGI